MFSVSDSATDIMEGANIGSPLLTSSIQYIINVTLTLPPILYLDKWGRRPSLLIGAFFMALFLFISGALQAVYGQENTGSTRTPQNSDVTWIVTNNRRMVHFPQSQSPLTYGTDVSMAIIAISYLFVATFALTWGPSSWTYPAEIFPSKIRAKAVSLATASNWGWNCALAFAVPPLLWNINWKMYMIFATFNALAFIHVYLAAPETKGKTLEEMESVFGSGRKPWHNDSRNSRLDELTKYIEEGKLKVIGRGGEKTEETIKPSVSHEEAVWINSG